MGSASPPISTGKVGGVVTAVQPSDAKARLTPYRRKFTRMTVVRPQPTPLPLAGTQTRATLLTSRATGGELARPRGRNAFCPREYRDDFGGSCCAKHLQCRSLRPQSQSMHAKREQRFLAPRALPLSYRDRK